MGLSLDLETTIAVACTIGVALVFWLTALAFQEIFGSRRFKRRLAAVQDRAQGNPLSEAVATRCKAAERDP